MKITWTLFVVLSLLASCHEKCRNKIARLYAADRNALAERREVNKFSLQLSYVPASLLMRDDLKDAQPAKKDTAFYYFKLRVVCPENNVAATNNATALYYGMDSMFATTDQQPLANPVLVEPVVTGSRKNFEYLLVFAKKDFTAGRQLKVVFFDRLFTNTKQVFVFDRIKIDEIETLQCYANEA
jgi:hypothetical protein